MVTVTWGPQEVPAGQVVTLTAEVKETGNYKYVWHVERDSLLEQGVGREASQVHWNTTGLNAGLYEVRVEIFDVSSEARIDEGKEQIVVTQGAVSRQDIQKLFEGAEGAAKLLKANLDDKLDKLTQEVTSVATGVGKVAQKLPKPGESTNVTLQRSEILSDDSKYHAAFFAAVRNRTTAIGFDRYNEFINRLLCARTESGAIADRGEAACEHQGKPVTASTASDFGSPSIEDRLVDDLQARPSIYGVDSYQLLKLATEAFLIFEAGVVVKPPRAAGNGQNSVLPIATVPDEQAHLGQPVTFQQITLRLRQYLSTGTVPGALPYLNRIVNALLGLDPNRREERLPYCDGILRRRFSCPSLLELIWSYWHEEGMLVQTLNAITLRFQNRRGRADKDPLAHLEIDPLRPLNNLLWGYIQDEMHRLSLPRRAYEYDHHYGLTTYGKAVPKLRSADSRSKFLEAFHHLLYRTSVFYHEDADTTVIADAFPLLNALREVHLLLAEGAHNQFGDLPWTARAEMLIQQWLLARPEMREFLRGRAMVPYHEAWMGQVDTMKRLQGWTDVTITHFHELAVAGEQILLSIRYYDWSVINNQDEAKLWARYWRPEIQRYIHGYRAVTGVDLTVEPVNSTLPGVHLLNRLAEQRRRAGRP